MIRFLQWVCAHYHKAMLRGCLSELKWHLKHGASLDHKHIKGLHSCMARHRRELARLGFIN